MTNLLTSPLVSVLLLPLIGWLLRYGYLHYRKQLRRARERGQSDLMEQVKDSFIHDVATNHLVHVYDAEKQMCEGLNAILTHLQLDYRIVLDEPPPIRFIPLDMEKK